MAQVKDLIVNGNSRLIGDTLANKVQLTTINAPTASNGTTYGPGSSGQVLLSNGTSVYWGEQGIASILGSSPIGSATQPIYWTGSAFTTATTYAGGTLVTLNNSAKGGTSVSFYAPTDGGTANYYLKSSGANTAPTWAQFSASTVGLGNVTNDAQIPKSIGTAKGDIIYWTASASPTRLAVGSNGTFLTVASGTPSWASLPSATTAAAGIVELSSSTAGSSETKAATEKAISDLYTALSNKADDAGVTSVTIQTSSPLSGGTSTAATSTGSWTIGFDTQDKNLVLASSSSTNGTTPTFRALVAADLPAATTAAAGIVELSSSTAGSSETKAATEKAISDLYTALEARPSGGGSVTQVSAGAGLTTTTDGTTDGGDITTSGTLNLTTLSVTTGTYGPTANVTGTNNTTIKVPQITVDKYGRITSVTQYTYTSRYAANTDAKVAQVNSTSDGAYRLLFSSAANNNTTTASAYKSGNLTFNPSTGAVTLTGTMNATTFNGALSNTLTIGNAEYNGSTAVTISIADLGLSTAITFLGITTTDVGSSTYENANTVAIVGGSNMTAANGNVVIVQSSGEEYVYVADGTPKWQHLGLATSYALANHVHGNIGNGGTISATTNAASGQHLVLTDSSNKIIKSSIELGSSANYCLANDGTWVEVNNYSLPKATTTTLGGISVGSGLSVDSDGELSLGSHDHGNISNDGKVSTTAAIANNFHLLLTNSSSSVVASSIIFDGSTTSSFLTKKGTWQEVEIPEVSLASDLTRNGSNQITHANTVTSATVGLSAAATATAATGSVSFAIPYVTYDSNGHITAGGTSTQTISGVLTDHQVIKMNGVTAATSTCATTGIVTSTIVNYGVCTVAAGTAAKTATITSGTLVAATGTHAIIKFNNANTANNPTLNVNSTGAKNIFHRGSRITTGTNKSLLAGVCDFVYDGTQWHLIGNYENTDTLVTQNAAITTAGAYPIILGASTATTTVTDVVNKAAALTYNPSTQKLAAPILQVTTASYGEVLPAASTIPTEGQLFFQISDDNGEDVYELPTGGSAGQVLVKNSAIDRDVVWSSDVTLNGYVQKSGDTMSGDLIVSKSGAESRIAASSNAGSIYMWSTGTSTGNVGISVTDGTNIGNLIYMNHSGTLFLASDDVYVSNAKIYGAVWNDYAEYRESDEVEPGRCVVEIGDGKLKLSEERLQRGCEIVSDTFGYSIGKSDKCNTPIAVSGRVLAYIYEGQEIAAKHIGWPVCSGPNGTVSIMTDREEKEYPSRVIGIISEVPNYETWGTGDVKVNGRVWIRIR